MHGRVNSMVEQYRVCERRNVAAAYEHFLKEDRRRLFHARRAGLSRALAVATRFARVLRVTSRAVPSES
jgi:hypothetical protein